MIKENYNEFLITSIGHFLVHSMTMILPAILIVLQKEFSISLFELGKLVTIQIMFLGLGGFPSGILVASSDSSIWSPALALPSS